MQKQQLTHEHENGEPHTVVVITHSPRYESMSEEAQLRVPLTTEIKNTDAHIGTMILAEERFVNK